MFGSLLATRLLAVSFYHFNKPDVALSGHVGARCVRADVLHSCKYRVITDVIRTSHEIRKGLFWIHRLNGTTLWRAENCLCSARISPTSLPHLRSVQSKTNSLSRNCITFSLFHFADVLSNMYFGRWKNLMIKGTTSDYHLNCLNLHLISYCLSLIFSCRGLQLQRLPFLMCTPVCVHFHPPSHFIFLFLLDLFILLSLSINLVCSSRAD